MAHVAAYKKDIVKDLSSLLKDYPIVGAVNMENLPAPQLQKMRAKLRDSVVLRMTKRRIMKIAIDSAKQTKPGIEQLKDHLAGMPALIFTKNNPFTLNKVLQQNKSSAPAKAGQTAPNDIVIPKGPTPFAPGPVIGELGAVGVKTGVENGKVAIKEDSLVAKRGDKISGKLAEILTRLNIEPMEVGLDLSAAYENGTIYTKDILSIDEQEYLDNVSNAGRWAFNLAMFIGYTTKDTIEPLLTKAYMDAKALGREQQILEPEIVEELVVQAERGMANLKSTANIPDSPEQTESKEPETESNESKTEEGSEKKESKDNSAPKETVDNKKESNESNNAEDKKDAPKEPVKETKESPSSEKTEDNQTSDDKSS